MQSRLRARGALQVGRALWLFAALATAPCALPAEPIGTRLFAQASEDEEATTPAENGSVATPSDAESTAPPRVEVLIVRGRSAAAIGAEIPASVTEFDAATIEALGAQDISDLSRVTPNVNIVQPGSTQAIFFVRGIGLSDFSSNAAGAVAIFQDEVALNAPAIQTGQLFDIEGVEIVRGPQGTGPFRNASAGAIRVRSRQPTGNYGARLRSTLGRYAADGGKGAEHGLIQEYEGALEIPIVEQALSSRFAFRMRDAEPYKRNGCGNAPPIALRTPAGRVANRPPDPGSICGEMGGDVLPVGQPSRIPVGLPEKIQSQHNWAARGTLRFQPADSEMDLVLNAHGSRLDQDQVFGQAIGTDRANVIGSEFNYGGLTNTSYQDRDQREEFEALCQLVGSRCTAPDPAGRLAKILAEGRPLDRRPYRGDYDRHGKETRDAWGGYASSHAQIGDLGAGMGGVEVSALASYDRYQRLQDIDADFTPEFLFEPFDRDEAWQTYEELRLGGELDVEPLQWEIGGYFLKERLAVDALTSLGLFGGRPVAIKRDYTQDTRAFGIWGGFEWDLWDDLTLEGGLRFNYERKEFDLTRKDIVLDLALPARTGKQRETWQEPTGEIALRYHLDLDSAVYLKYGHGFKAGHFNALPGINDVAKPPADEEINDAWEIGLSGSWLDRRVFSSLSFFYYRYQGYQVFHIRDDPRVNPVLEILNAEEVENYGVEIEARFEPLRGWTPRLLEALRLSGHFAWLHGEYIDFQLVELEEFSGSRVLPISFDFSGNKLQNSPEFGFSATAEWTLDLGRWGSLIPRYDVNWSDDVFFNIREGRGLRKGGGSEELPEFAIGQPAFFLHNVRLTYRTPAMNIEVAGWIRNLDDQVYKTFAFDVSRFRGVVVNYVGEPRTLGVDFTITF